MKLVALYCRVSTTEQAEHGYSIDEQVARLNDYCKAMGWTVVKTYIDAGYSGANTDRPALRDLVEASQSHSFDAVAVFKLDRLSRSQKDTLSLVEGFLSSGVEFVSMTENFDTSTPFGRATIGILSVFAQLEREQIKERMGLGKTGRAKSGKWRGGGYTPVGYDYKDGELVVNEYEAMQIRLIHELYQSGESFRAIAAEMNRRGYTHKHGEWQVKRVRSVLLNDLYIGKIKHRGEAYDGTHEAIIDKSTFERTQAVYGAVNAPKNPHKGKSMLGGLLYCKRCGARYGICRTSSHNLHQYYCCHSRRKTSPHLIKDPNCKNKNWKKEELEGLIAGEIKKLTIEPDSLADLMPKHTDNTATLNAEIEKLNRQKSRLTDLYGKELLTVDELTDKIKPINAQIEKLKAELSASTDFSEMEDVAEKIQNFSDALELGNGEQIHILTASLIDRIELDGDDVTIFWSFC